MNSKALAVISRDNLVAAIAQWMYSLSLTDKVIEDIRIIKFGDPIELEITYEGEGGKIIHFGQEEA